MSFVLIVDGENLRLGLQDFFGKPNVRIDFKQLVKALTGSDSIGSNQAIYVSKRIRNAFTHCLEKIGFNVIAPIGYDCDWDDDIKIIELLRSYKDKEDINTVYLLSGDGGFYDILTELHSCGKKIVLVGIEAMTNNCYYEQENFVICDIIKYPVFGDNEMQDPQKELKLKITIETSFQSKHELSYYLQQLITVKKEKIL